MGNEKIQASEAKVLMAKEIIEVARECAEFESEGYFDWFTQGDWETYLRVTNQNGYRWTDEAIQLAAKILGS